MSDHSNITGGYVLLPREFYKQYAHKLSPIARDVYIFLLQKVNFRDSGTHEKGSCFILYEEIISGLSWKVGFRKMTYTKNQISACIKSLKKSGLIETQKSSRGMHVTIKNYKQEQDPSSYITDS